MNDMRLYLPDELAADGYPPQWHHTIKHDVRAVAGDRCIRCAHPYTRGAGEWSPCDDQCTHRGPYRYRHGPTDEWFITHEGDEPWIAPAGEGPDVGIEIQAHWRILTVHHLDGNKANCRWWNLTSLCQRCHLQIQGKVRMERRWLHEHSDWFKPYVAGFYAFDRLGLDLPRPEVEARLDELLALEARQLELGAPA